MLGYVTIYKSEMKVREYEMYQGYYCGICKSIGKRYGQIPRMTLSYDAVFLALIIASLNESRDTVKQEHCITHHIKKNPVVYGNDAVDYAADMMVILAYHKLLDDWKDDRDIKAFGGKTLLHGAYRKLKGKYPESCSHIEASLEKLSLLEKEKSGSLDSVSEAFADIMEILFTGFDGDTREKRALKEVGRNLGKWIYVIDAFDDLEKDKKDGAYNPLIYRRNEALGVEDLLYEYLAATANAYDLLSIQKNKGILDNIIFMGLRSRTDAIARKGNEINE